VDIALVVDGAPMPVAAEDETAGAHAAADSSPAASESVDSERERDMATIGGKKVTAIGFQK
jgi:hypothetical protein